MWNAVRKVKVETSLDIECGQDGLYLGKTSDDDYSEDPRESQVQALEYELGIESSWEKFENMTDEDLPKKAVVITYCWLKLVTHLNLNLFEHQRSFFGRQQLQTLEGYKMW